MNFLDRLKTDAQLLLIVMLVLAAIVLGFFFFWAGLVLLFFVGLAIWLVFIFAYLKVLFEYSFAFRVATFLILSGITALLIYLAIH